MFNFDERSTGQSYLDLCIKSFLSVQAAVRCVGEHCCKQQPGYFNPVNIYFDNKNKYFSG